MFSSVYLITFKTSDRTRFPSGSRDSE